MKRRWDDDVVFKNQARGTEDKGKKEFVNVSKLCLFVFSFPLIIPPISAKSRNPLLYNMNINVMCRTSFAPISTDAL